MFCAFIVFKLAGCCIVRSKLEGHIIAAIFFTFLVYTKSYKCFSCNYNATHFCLIGGSIRRQIANPTRPTRTLTSFTRGVRRGDWFSSTSTQEFPLNYCVHPVITLTIMLQVEKTKALMPMEIRLTSQQSCSISHGTQLRIPSHVLLQIACICIMRRECPTENLLFFFWLAPHEGPGPFNCNQRDGAGRCHQFCPWGPEEAADVHKLTLLLC